ncbi:hypothetical protein [Clostridium sp. AF32-12BH]|uniref:hypothetical protein n=1 Tax=Clostridium sp. AF32-12BH TaxID=2292006 RepID=UPI0015FCFFDD|nr:hypothetical protein [Clostridium sp. AF32-12BH]
MSNYQKRKKEVQNEAIEWQQDFGNQDYSYSDLVYYGNYFAKLGRRYGLLKEFKANGIC